MERLRRDMAYAQRSMASSQPTKSYAQQEMDFVRH